MATAKSSAVNSDCFEDGNVIVNDVELVKSFKPFNSAINDWTFNDLYDE